MKRSKKLKRKLAGRIVDYENLIKGGGNTVRKHPTGFTKPGSNK
jgi:hypothetical protein